MALALPRLRIAVPCHADWGEMVRDERVRTCGACARPVYNVAELGRREIARLIAQYEGRPPCLRLFVRPDGTVITRSCLATVKRAARRVALRVTGWGAMALAFWANVVVLRMIAARPGGRRPAPTAVASRVAEPPASTVWPRTPPHSAEAFESAGGLPRLPVRPLRTDGTPRSMAELLDAFWPIVDQVSGGSDVRGKIVIHAIVTPGGRVRRVRASGALARTPFGRALVREIRRARLQPAASGMRVALPFALGGARAEGDELAF